MTIDDARENFMSDVYNTLDFLPTNNEANRIIDSFDRVTSGLNQQPCEDCISRQASVIPKEKTGHWIIKDGKEQGYDIAGVKTWYIQIMCDKCGFINSAIEGHTGQYHFCPNCGAKMQEVENDT